MSAYGLLVRIIGMANPNTTFTHAVLDSLVEGIAAEKSSLIASADLRNGVADNRCAVRTLNILAREHHNSFLVPWSGPAPVDGEPIRVVPRDPRTNGPASSSSAITPAAGAPSNPGPTPGPSGSQGSPDSSATARRRSTSFPDTPRTTGSPIIPPIRRLSGNDDVSSRVRARQDSSSPRPNNSADTSDGSTTPRTGQPLRKNPRRK